MAEQVQINVVSAQKELTEEMRGIHDLCAAWPAVKQVLQKIIDVTKNPFIKLAITVVIAAGDAICSKK